jgi:hypothetical protein
MAFLTLRYRARNPCVVPPTEYVPTRSPCGLILKAAEDEAPATSMLVKLPSLSSRNPCVVLPAEYWPTMSPRGLIAWACVDEAPGKSMVGVAALSKARPILRIIQ